MSTATAIAKKKPWALSPSVKAQKEYNVAGELRKISLDIKWRDGATCCSDKDCRLVKWCFWHKEALVLETDWENASNLFLIGDARSTYSCLLFLQSTKDLRDFLIKEGVSVQLGDIITLEAKVCNCKGCEGQSKEIEVQLELSPEEQTAGELIGKDRLTDYEACLNSDPSIPVSVIAYCDRVTNEPCYVMINQVTGEVNKNAAPNNWTLPYKQNELACKRWVHNFAAIDADLKLDKAAIIQAGIDAGLTIEEGVFVSDFKEIEIGLKFVKGEAHLMDGSTFEASTSDMLIQNCNGFVNVDDGGQYPYKDIGNDFCITLKQGSVMVINVLFS